MTHSAQRPAFLLLAGIGILVTLVVVVLARLAYGLVLPAMRASLGLSYSQAANLGTVTALGYLSLVMVAGLFAARFGARRSILLGFGLACLGFIGLALSTSYSMLVALMILLGVATAFAYTPMISLLGAWYPERRGAIIGLANSGVGIGMLITGSLVPYLTNRDTVDGWRDVWWLFALATLVVGVFFIRVLRDPPTLQIATTTGVASAFKTSVYRNPHVLTIGALYGVVGVIYIVQSLFMYSYALEAGVNAINAGRLVALMGFISIFSGPLWGTVADRIGYSNALMISMSMTFTGTLVPVLWPVTLGFALHYALLGIAITGLFTSILAASTSTVPLQQAPIAVSLVTLFFAIGQLLGPATAGLMVGFPGGFKLIFTLCCILMVFGVGIAAFSRITLRQTLASLK